MSAPLIAHHAALIGIGEIERDSAQEEAVALLAQLETRLVEHRLARKSSSLGWLFGRREQRREPIKGIYIHGDVGRGKTMLMDMFFAASAVVRKRRSHFHEFMAEVHERVFALRSRAKRGENGEDPIRAAATAIAEETWLLCFDEFHVTDIADAMILGRLFNRLFELGVVLVATSNMAPGALYQDGLNRALFVPFIDALEARMDVVRLEARADFRLEKLASRKVWHVPADETADAALDEAWRALTGGRASAAQELPLRGRVLHVPRAAMGVARFSFHELCEQPLGAADYLRIAREFHTLVLDRIPAMDYSQRNAARRFIILIDTLYDNAVKLVASAADEPARLYQAEEGFEAQEFRRTASRLIEMVSQAYLALAHGRPGILAAPSGPGIVET